MSSKKSKKRNNSRSQNLKNNRLKYMEDEDKELDELEEIISKSEAESKENENSDDNEENYITDDYLNDESYEDIEESVEETSDENSLEDEEEENEDFFASLDAKDEEVKTFKERKSKNTKKILPDNLNEFIKDNLKCVICGSIIGVLTIALIIALAFDRSGKDSSGDAKVHTSGNITKDMLQETGDKAIVELVNNYFTALTEGDLNKLSEIMDSVDGISADTLKAEGEYIEEYKNVKCYVKDGLNKNEYVVYVYYENKILNIDTLAPGAIILYVKKDAASNEYKIQSNINDDKISKYIKKLSKEKDIINFNKEVDDKLDKACIEDPDLKALRDALISSGNEETSSESGSDSQETQPQNETTVPEQTTSVAAGE